MDKTTVKHLCYFVACIATGAVAGATLATQPVVAGACAATSVYCAIIAALNTRWSNQ